MSEPKTWYRGEMIPRAEYERIIAEENARAAQGDIASCGLNGKNNEQSKNSGQNEASEVAPERVETMVEPVRSIKSPIPEQLRECRFILVKARDKPAIEKGWQTTANYAYDDPRLLQHIANGGNYGVMPDGGVCILDADQTDRLMELGVLDRLLETFVVRTGRKDGYGSHFYIRCPDAPAEKFILRDPETRADLGDLRGSGHKSFCVGPGCTHPSGGRYEVVNDAPLLEIPWSELKALV